ncbi:MAG TPA: glycosyltransferase [Baekduia sp.]|nr:glycosyltransferase [Baekduia sp.]
MRVAVVHNLSRGGAWRRLSEQARALDAEVVEVCLSSAVSVADRGVKVPLRALASAAPRAARPPLRYADVLLLRHAWRRAARAVRDVRPDVVLANPCQILQGPAGIAWTGVPTLYFCDEPRRADYEDPDGARRNPRTRRLYAPLHDAERRLDRLAALSADRLVTNSRYTAATIEAAYGRPADVVALGVPDAFLAPRPADAAHRPGHVLSVGTLIPTKGHDLAIAAVARAATRRPLIVVAGHGEDTERRRLLALAREHGIGLDLRIGISDAELRDLYAGAHALLYLSAREPLGLASLEAQASGTPVVVADDGGIPETIIPGETGFAVARDAAAAAAALDRLDDPDLRARMGAAAAAHGATYTWARSAAELRALLEAVAAAGATPGRARG